MTQRLPILLRGAPQVGSIDQCLLLACACQDRCSSLVIPIACTALLTLLILLIPLQCEARIHGRLHREDTEAMHQRRVFAHLQNL